MRRVKTITIILAIILITMVAFAGVYIKTQNRMENKVKDYSFGRELKGERVAELKVVTPGESDTEAKKNLTVENYEIVKNTIEKRLNNLQAPDYTISLNKENGTIIVELPEDNNTDIYVHYLTASGEVKIAEDGENGAVLLSDSMIEKGLYSYTSDIEGAYQVSLDLYLTKEGQAKIEEIKNNYAIFADEISDIEAKKAEDKEAESTEKEDSGLEENTDTKTEETKKIARLTIGGTQYDIERIENNKVRVSMGPKTTNSNYINSYISVASEASMLINSGKMPVKYELGQNRFLNTDILENQMIYFVIALAIILLVVFIVFVISYKMNGLLASISYIGFVSLLTLILRYTNVNISIEGIGAIILILILNIRINQMILNNYREKNDVKESIISTYKNIFLKLVPIIIITITFCFAGVSNLISFGMIMFWGLLLIAVYNAIVTKTLLKLRESK